MTSRLNLTEDSPQLQRDTGDELLTIDELAGLLKVPKSWIYAHTRPRSKIRLPHVKLGKYLRFSEQDVRAFLQRLNRG
jgi:excisionase family DNA binding protein